jgi:hypothetical protein
MWIVGATEVQEYTSYCYSFRHDVLNYFFNGKAKKSNDRDPYFWIKKTSNYAAFLIIGKE